MDKQPKAINEMPELAIVDNWDEVRNHAITQGQ